MEKISKKWINNIFKMEGRCDNSITEKFLLSEGFKKTFKIINIVGTNGKGSVSQYVTDALIAEGFKVGKFTSPHLFKYNERITINNKEISDQDFFDIVNPRFEDYNKERIMYFPLCYIVGMIYFQRNNVDYVVLEAGIGGEEDPTSIIDGDYGILTSIGEDHLDWFKTKENISIDKAGIMNENMVFFLPKKLDKFSKNIFKKTAKEKNIKLIEVDNFAINYQESNKKMANALFKYITSKNIQKFNTPFGRTSIKIKNNVNYIYDVGHNYDAIYESLKLLKTKNVKFDQVILSLSANKDDEKIYDLFNCNISIFKHTGPNPMQLKDYKKSYNKILYSLEDIKNIKSNVGILYIGSFHFINDLFKDERDN